MDALEQKYQRLQEILTQFGRVAVAFSGGVDSTFLLYAAHATLGEDALAVTAVTAALPQRERQGAEALCAQLGVRRLVYPLDVLTLPAFQTNPPDRCYHCKRALFQGMLTLTQAAGFPTLVDGSNVDDTGDYRPGMRALAELGIQSPLLTAGLTKGDIRALSHRFHLPTWNQPSAACLASRIPYGEAITGEKLALVEQAEQEAAEAARELAEIAHLRRGQIVVIGCSTSEVVGHQVGSWSTPEVADAIFRGLSSVFSPMGVYLAAQCCEHLNRALIVEHEAVPNGEIVNVLPQPKAGSSFATAAYKAFRHPVALEEIHADAGLDIGGTLIGMHLKKVAVPVRLKQNRIGQAIVLAARTRPKFIGGERAIYDESLKDGYPDFTD